ncbi:MAG: transposase [Bacillota bacterium]|nr:transposase [Bacillota bacterium]
MPYDVDTDAYICHAGHRIEAVDEKKTKSKTGYPIVTTVYSCAHCDGCPHKEKCIKGASKKPLEERSKNLHVSKNFQEQRMEMRARICDTPLPYLAEVASNAIVNNDVG